MFKVTPDVFSPYYFTIIFVFLSVIFVCEKYNIFVRLQKLWPHLYDSAEDNKEQFHSKCHPKIIHVILKISEFKSKKISIIGVSSKRLRVGLNINHDLWHPHYHRVGLVFFPHLCAHIYSPTNMTLIITAYKGLEFLEAQILVEGLPV